MNNPVRRFQYHKKNISKMRNIQKAKIRQLTVSHRQILMNESNFSIQDKICLPGKNRIDIVALDDILVCKALGNYAEVLTKSGMKYIVSKTLSWVEDKISSSRFLRVHQSYLVQLDLVTSIEKTGSYQLTLTGFDESIPISRSKHKTINEIFGCY